MGNQVWMEIGTNQVDIGTVEAFVTHAVQLQVFEGQAGGLRVSHLEEATGWNRYKLLRAFKLARGEDLRARILREKMRHASVRLQLTRVPILHIAGSAGYACQQSFTRSFSRHFGLSPAQVRRQAQAKEGAEPSPELPAGQRIRQPGQAWWVKSCHAAPEDFGRLLGRFRVDLLRMGLASHQPVRAYRYEELSTPDSTQVRLDFAIQAPQGQAPPTGWIGLRHEAGDFRRFPAQGHKPAAHGEWMRQTVRACAYRHGESMGGCGMFWQSATGPGSAPRPDGGMVWISVE